MTDLEIKNLLTKMQKGNNEVSPNELLKRYKAKFENLVSLKF